MRDSTVIALAQRADAKSAQLFKQFLFMRTRLEAMETVLAKYLPEGMNLKSLLDEEHGRLWQEEAQKIADAEKKAKEESRKPKITVVPA